MTEDNIQVLVGNKWAIAKIKTIEELKKVKEIVFYDFILVANRQNGENTLYLSLRYK